MTLMMEGTNNTLSAHDLGNTNKVTQAKIRGLLRDLQTESLGGKFLIAVSKDIVGPILEEVWLKL